MIRAVVYDMGGTLWFEGRTPDEARIYRLAAERLAPLVRGWNVALREPLEVIEREVWEAALDAYRLGGEHGTHREPHLPELIRDTLARRGVRIDEEQSRQWWRVAYLPVREFGWQLFPDTLHVLSECKDIGLKIGICTNRPFTSEMFASDLDDYGLARYVDAVACSGDTGYVKPHPSVFELVLARLGVAPSDAVMVGDSCAADIEGAKRVGMFGVLKLNGRYDAQPCADADEVIHDLGELLELALFPGRARAAVSTESLTPHEDANEDRY